MNNTSYRRAGAFLRRDDGAPWPALFTETRARCFFLRSDRVAPAPGIPWPRRPAGEGIAFLNTKGDPALTYLHPSRGRWSLHAGFTPAIAGRPGQLCARPHYPPLPPARHTLAGRELLAAGKPTRPPTVWPFGLVAVHHPTLSAQRAAPCRTCLGT